MQEAATDFAAELVSLVVLSVVGATAGFLAWSWKHLV